MADRLYIALFPETSRPSPTGSINAVKRQLTKKIIVCTKLEGQCVIWFVNTVVSTECLRRHVWNVSLKNAIAFFTRCKKFTSQLRSLGSPQQTPQQQLCQKYSNHSHLGKLQFLISAASLCLSLLLLYLLASFFLVDSLGFFIRKQELQ